MIRFREFVKRQPFVCTLREEEAAPVASPDVPDNPDKGKTNKHHFDSLQRELGIDDDAFKGALEGGIQTLYKVPDYGWGFRVQPPIQATVQDIGTGQYKVTFMLAQKKLSNPKSFVLPYNKDQTTLYYDGPVEDKTVMMNQEELSDLLVPPYESSGGGGMGGMGGPPGLGGGMPPMGGM